MEGFVNFMKIPQPKHSLSEAIAGYSLLACPFILVGYFAVKYVGTLETLVIFGGLLVALGCLYYGIAKSGLK